jgi:hypothetical protein
MRGADCLTLESLLAVVSTPLSAGWNMRNGTWADTVPWTAPMHSLIWKQLTRDKIAL